MGLPEAPELEERDMMTFFLCLLSFGAGLILAIILLTRW